MQLFRQICVAAVVFLVFLSVLALGGLLQMSQKFVPEPDEATAAALEAAGERWWRPTDTTYRQVPEAEWPAELRNLQPEHVSVNSSGVFIKFGCRFVEIYGLFVLPIGSAFRPKEGQVCSFRLIRGRVYRYDDPG